MSSLWPSSSSTSCASTNTFVYAGARHVTQSALDLHAVLQADRSFTGGEYTATDPDSPSTILKSTHCICILFSSHLGTDLLAPTSYSLKDSVFALKLMHNYEQESMDHKSKMYFVGCVRLSEITVNQLKHTNQSTHPQHIAIASPCFGSGLDPLIF
ncbi:hypothetical protein PMIN02_012077 [Paraphaeosphaeria minitans]